MYQQEPRHTWIRLKGRDPERCSLQGKLDLRPRRSDRTRNTIDFILRPANIFMEQKSKLSFTVRNEDEGGFSAQCIEIPGIITQAETESELTEMRTDAVNGYFESFPEEKKILQNTRKNKVIEISV